MVASNADTSLLFNDNRITVDDVLDENLQNVVAEWRRNSPSHAVDGSSVRQTGNGAIGAGLVAPQPGYVVALSSENGVVPHCDDGGVTQALPKNPNVARVSQSQTVGGSIGASLVTPQVVDDVQITPQPSHDVAVNSVTGVAVHGNGGDKNHVVPVFQPHLGPGCNFDGSNVAPIAGAGFVFKAGSSGTSFEGKTGAPTIRGPKSARVVLQGVRPVLSCNSGARLGAGPAPNRNNPPNPLPIRTKTAVPVAVPAGAPEGAKVRPQFSDILKDNRIVGNGLKLQHYDPMENDDDVVLDKSD
ncbi:hypothetical protein LIER_40032 [Lithospermum erythrorhizon]|uniref:DUF4150 domain-containing protein n=1 Tax=Lithospermum erythrorhizon TaxID=34254 RepID=A0AAV3QR18_LITER